MSLSPERIAFYIFVLFLVLIAVVVIRKVMPKKVKHDKYVDKWKNLQSKLIDKNKWGEAVVEADDLLVEALQNKIKKLKVLRLASEWYLLKRFLAIMTVFGLAINYDGE